MDTYIRKVDKDLSVAHQKNEDPIALVKTYNQFIIASSTYHMFPILPVVIHKHIYTFVSMMARC